MASRLLSRAKNLTLSCRLLHHPYAPSDPVGLAHCLRAVGSLASSHPRPDPRSASAAPAPIANRSSPVGSCLARAQVFDHLVSGKISCERTLQNCTFSPLHGSEQFLARSFHVKAQGGETKIQADNTRLQHN
ncbi:unnamed protein product, partial [Musa textilis]